MSSEHSTPKYLQGEKSFISEEYKELISTLPKDKGWQTINMYQYQGFWYPHTFIEGVIAIQKHFQAKENDIFLVTYPKSGTTWLKAMMFTLLNRKTVPVGDQNHPLLTHNPHALVPQLEHLYGLNGNITEMMNSSSSTTFFAVHIPYITLPESVKSNSSCKVVYLCRNPKDTFMSLWNFMNRVGVHDEGKSLENAFEIFCEGMNAFGPYWDHVLEYWKQSQENPSRVCFMKYEDFKEEPGLHLRRLSQFLECPFSADEEETGLVDQILKLCSFDNLSGLEINKNGKLSLTGVEYKVYFYQGKVGGWKNHLSAEMAQKIDQITEEKFFGSGLVL